jgi:pimeloyl-ACP methyl ester carboxylesterase
MSELIKVLGCDNPGRTGDIVFVHGLDGNARTTWRSVGQSGSSWPDWLGEDLPNVGVWLFSYEVPSSAWRGHTMPLADRATNALALLDAEGLGERPLVFIAHSLGGLLVKQMLRHARDYGEPRWRSIVDETRGTVFLSTPHSGSDIANWIKHLSLLLQNTVSVQELEANDPRLRELNIWFRNNLQLMGIHVEVYCEKVPIHGFIVVDDTSADPGLAGVIPVPLDENHVTICKPPSKESLLYKRVRRFIHDCLSENPR